MRHSIRSAVSSLYFMSLLISEVLFSGGSSRVTVVEWWRKGQRQWRGDPKYTAVAFGQRRSENFVKEFVRRWRSVVCCRGFIHTDVPFTAESCKAPLTPDSDPFRLQGLTDITYSRHLFYAVSLFNMILLLCALSICYSISVLPYVTPQPCHWALNEF